MEERSSLTTSSAVQNLAELMFLGAIVLALVFILL